MQRAITKRAIIVVALCLILVFILTAGIAAADTYYTERVQIGWSYWNGWYKMPVYCNIGSVSWLSARGYLDEGWEPIAIWKPVNNSAVTYELVYHQDWEVEIPTEYDNITKRWFKPTLLRIE